MPTLEDIAASATGKSKQQLQEALLELIKGNPDILDSVTRSTTGTGGRSSDRSEGATRSGDEEDRRSQRSPSASYPELENSLNQQSRAGYQWQLSDSDDGIDPAWTTATKNMTPRELNRWRKKLFSIYVGHLPHDITKKELVQLFSEVGNVQDVHLQPPNVKGGGYTYGFVRFCTLDECRDAVAMLHGRFLGNRTITVEFACETKERLTCDDPDDLPLDRKDKLLRNDFPRVEHLNRPMSDVESQEKMVLWKLRCSATKQKSSNTTFLINGQEGNKEEVLMNALQEIVKKVVSLPADTLAPPTGSEGSPCSPWVLKEINGGSNGVPAQQSHSEKPMKDEEMKCNGTHEYGISQVTDVKHTHDKGSTDNQKDLRQPQTLPLIREGQAQSPEASGPNLYSTPDSQSTRNSLSPGRYVSANRPGETPSTGREFLSSRPEVTPSPGSYASLSSPGVTPSPGRHVSPTSPVVTPSLGKEFPLSSPDITPSPRRYTFPSSVAPSQGRYVSPSSPGVAPSPRRDDSSHSEMETNTSDSVSLGSLSPERPVRQHCQFCHGRSPTKGHASESSLSESISSSSSQPTASSCAFCHEGEERLGKVDDSHAIVDQKLSRHMQYDNKQSLETLGIKGVVHHGPPNANRFSGMGLCSFDSDDSYNKEPHTSSRLPQQIGSSVSRSLSQQDKKMNQASDVGNARMDAEVQDSKGSATVYNRALSSNQCHSQRDRSGFGQGSVPRQPHVVCSSSSVQMPPVARHHQQELSHQNETKSSNTGPLPSKPLSPNGTTVSPSAVPAPPPASDTVRPRMQQPLLSNPPHWPGHHQQIHPLLANFMAARLQQPGFPRHQFGNSPLIPPGVFDPAMFQEWNRNSLIQQQLLASRLPFGLPFQTGGQQPWLGVGPLGPVQNQAQRHRLPFGRHDIGHAGRGRPFAPRFHSPGVVNIRSEGDLEKSIAGMPSTLCPEQSSSVENNLETQKDTVESNRSTTSDAQTSNVRLAPVPPLSYESEQSASVKSISVDSDATKLSSRFSPTSDFSPKSVLDTVPKESRDETGCQGISCSQEPDKKERVIEEGQLLASPPTSALPKQEADLESTRTTKTPPRKLSPSELLLKEQKSVLKRIVQGNEMLRQCIDWRSSGGVADSSDALKQEIHLKEVQLQKEKEIMLARKAEQELLYEREKLEAAFDQQLKKELETEQRIGETENKIRLAKLENELLVLYQNLYGNKEQKDIKITADKKT
ncbi:uncharacterized protein LOC144653369 isoform X2 [Oculina patagonica]